MTSHEKLVLERVLAGTVQPGHCQPVTMRALVVPARAPFLPSDIPRGVLPQGAEVFVRCIFGLMSANSTPKWSQLWQKVNVELATRGVGLIAEGLGPDMVIRRAHAWEQRQLLAEVPLPPRSTTRRD